MKKKTKISYNNRGEIIEIKVRDFSGRTIEKFKFNGTNSEMYGRILESLYIRYGFRPIIRMEESINFKKFTGDKLSLFDY